MDALYRLSPEAARERWDQIGPWLSRACAKEGGSFTADDIMASIERNEMQLWGAFNEHELDAIAVTEIRVTPRRKICWVLIMTGKHLERWQELRHEIAAWARSEGCKGRGALKSLARRGYLRMFGEYRCTHVLLELDL